MNNKTERYGNFDAYNIAYGEDEEESGYKTDLEDFTAERMFLQKFDRILSSDMKISVNDDADRQKSNTFGNYTKDPTSPTAYADMKNNAIWIDFPNLYEIFGKNYTEFIKSLKGLNHHELAHLLFTFKPNHHKYSLTPPQHRLHNIMEDGRIETLFSDMYPSTRNYFIRNISKFIAILPEDLPKYNKERLSPTESLKVAELRNLTIAYMLTYGRKFFDPKFTQKVRPMLIARKKALPQYSYNLKNVERIINTFLVTTDYDKQKALTLEMEKELAKLFSDSVTENIPSLLGMNEVTQGGGKKQNSKAMKLTQEQLEQLKDLIKQALKQSANQPEDDKAEGSDANEQKKKEESDKKAQEQREREALDETMKQERENPNSEKPKDVDINGVEITSHGNTPMDTDKNPVMANLVKEIVADVDKLIESEIRDDIKKISEMKKAGDEHILMNGTPYIIKTEDKIMSKRLVTIIQRLRQDMRPTYVKKLKAGNIDVRRVVQNANKEVVELEVFRKYRNSKINKTQMGVAILIDSSGSMMEDEYELALRSAYCVGETLQKTGSKSMVIAFDTKFHVLKKFSDPINKLDLGRKLNGGTSPEPALLYSEKELDLLRKKEGIKHLLIVTISDCDFDDTSFRDETIKSDDRTSLGNILNRLHRKFKMVIFRIGSPTSKHHLEDALRKRTHFLYRIGTFQEIYKRLQEFVKKYEMMLHRDVARGF